MGALPVSVRMTADGSGPGCMPTSLPSLLSISTPSRVDNDIEGPVGDGQNDSWKAIKSCTTGPVIVMAASNHRSQDTLQEGNIASFRSIITYLEWMMPNGQKNFLVTRRSKPRTSSGPGKPNLAHCVGLYFSPSLGVGHNMFRARDDDEKQIWTVIMQDVSSALSESAISASLRLSRVIEGAQKQVTRITSFRAVLMRGMIKELKTL